MKKHYFTATRLMMAVALAAGFSACSNENDNVDITKKGEPISITAQISVPADTRTTVTPGTGGTASVKWAGQDAFELFGNADHQTFTLAAGGEDKSSANFTGTAVGASATYHAFYPASKAKKADGQTAADNFSEIVLSVAGQTQTGDDAASHLGAYSYMTASKSAQNNFSFTHLMMMLSLDITLPEAATPTSLVISTPDGNLLYSTMNADGTGKVAVNEQTLTLSGFSNATTFKAHLMMIPFALSNQKMVITVNCEGSKKYAITKENVTMNYNAGLRYTATVTLAATSSSSVFDEAVLNSSGEDYSGEGTANDPFVISNAMQLRKMQENPTTAYYKLDTDIHVTAPWSPIGYFSRPFTGAFDGNNHKITGALSFSYSTDNTEYGFFGAIQGATIKNLKIEANVTNQSTAMNSATGGIAGFCKISKSTITNCEVTGNVTGGSGQYCRTGGIAGNAAFGELINCRHSSGTITGVGSGGIAGYSGSTSVIYDCCTSTFTPLLGAGSTTPCPHGTH